MKRLIFTIATISLMIAAISAGTVSAAGKLTICHATSSAGNPFVAITVDEGAALTPHLDDNGNPLNGHEQDFILPGEQTAEDCEEAANPTDPPTDPPTQPPTDAPTDPPTEAPTLPPTEAPTLPPTEAPTVPPTEPPTDEPPVISAFAVEPAPCRFEGDDSRLRFRVLVGLILLSQVDIYIDGELINRDDITFDAASREAFVTVAPGLRAWTITEEGDPEAVLAEGETLCPTCFDLATPTPPPAAPTNTPGTTLPPTDTVGDTVIGSTSLLAVVLLTVVSIVAYAIASRRVWR